MNNKKEIVIDIDANGEIHAETFGFQGVDCETELDKLMKGLANTRKTTRKQEFYQNKISSKQKQNVGQK